MKGKSASNNVQSPFVIHRDKVLGYYSTASWLRRLVLAMWNGSGYPVGLSQLTNLDADHREAAMAMIASYAVDGEGDPAFMALADECRARLQEEEAAAERSEQLDVWMREVARYIRGLGGRRGWVDDHYTWLERLFDGDTSPEQAAQLAMTSNLEGM